MGWFIKRKDGIFDDTVATFMDFNLPQNGNTRFMYVLPIDKKTALFEYTLFSKNRLEYSEYEQAILDYLKKKNIFDYELLEKEHGSIPMTSFKFEQLNSNRIVNIGTAEDGLKQVQVILFTILQKKQKIWWNSSKKMMTYQCFLIETNFGFTI